MGFGASVAGGCSIGNGLVETAIMSWKGWIALGSMILGVWFYELLYIYKTNEKLENKHLSLKQQQRQNKYKQLN